MKFIIVFEDAPDADPDIRRTFMSAHLDFLELHSDTVQAAGPLIDTHNRGLDGLWIADAATVEDLDRLVHEDPFWATGLRKSYSIIEWKQVYANGTRLV